MSLRSAKSPDWLYTEWGSTGYPQPQVNAITMMQQKNQKETATAKIKRRDSLSEPKDEATIAM